MELKRDSNKETNLKRKEFSYGCFLGFAHFFPFIIRLDNRPVGVTNYDHMFLFHSLTLPFETNMNSGAFYDKTTKAGIACPVKLIGRRGSLDLSSNKWTYQHFLQSLWRANLDTRVENHYLQPHTRGFINIDCGMANNDSIYIDDPFHLTCISDAQFIDTGVNENVRIFRNDIVRLYRTLISFPNGNRNCYQLGPVNKSNKYLIRAHFMYGDYDGKNSTPEFNLYIGVNLWSTISFSNSTDAFSKKSSL